MASPRHHQTTIAAFACPHCTALVRVEQRLPYPRDVIGLYAPVYRCARCHRHTGEPVMRGGEQPATEENLLTGATSVPCLT